jgi:predicted Fe-S protein YdhL (DUF1289 family)
MTLAHGGTLPHYHFRPLSGLARRSRMPLGPPAHPVVIAPDPMAALHITDIEAAINHWRARKPSPDGITLAPELRALAEVYALMVYHREEEVAEEGFPPAAWEAWLAWYDTTPDTPCIAICSTSQGDDECKGCGRSFDEVQHWPAMTPTEKRRTWRRITLDDTAWRFNTYAERAREKVAESPAAEDPTLPPELPVAPMAPAPSSTDGPAPSAATVD